MRLIHLALAAVIALAVPPAVRAETQVPRSQGEMLLSFAPVVKRTAPAVVNVYAQRIVASRQEGIGADPFFRRFFGENGGFGRSRERVQNSLGSGVIVDPSGIIVTNNHVIRGGSEIKVVLADRREFEAKRRPDRRAHRPCGASDRRERRGAAGPDPGRLRWPRSGRSGACHRQSLWRRTDGDQRHRLGAGAYPGRHHRLWLLHPDRCGHQSRQLGWCAGQHGGRAGGHQHRDLLEVGRLHRHRLRHSRRHGEDRHRLCRGGLGGQASLARGGAAGCHGGDRRLAGHGPAGRRAGREPASRQPAERRRAEARRHHRGHRGQARREFAGAGLSGRDNRDRSKHHHRVPARAVPARKPASPWWRPPRRSNATRR